MMIIINVLKAAQQSMALARLVFTDPADDILCFMQAYA